MENEEMCSAEYCKELDKKLQIHQVISKEKNTEN